MNKNPLKLIKKKKIQTFSVYYLPHANSKQHIESCFNRDQQAQAYYNVIICLKNIRKDQSLMSSQNVRRDLLLVHFSRSYIATHLPCPPHQM